LLLLLDLGSRSTMTSNVEVAYEAVPLVENSARVIERETSFFTLRRFTFVFRTIITIVLLMFAICALWVILRSNFLTDEAVGDDATPVIRKRNRHALPAGSI
jgi:hypothetical protein